jgi:hypothetical protein
MVSLALSQHSIHRLTETWKGLDESTRAKWTAVQEFTNFIGNCKVYRSYLKRLCASATQRNFIPYIGLCLKDLTFIEDGNNTHTSAGSINFEKMRMVANIINQIQVAQRSKYTLPKDLSVMTFLAHNLIIFDEDTVYPNNHDILLYCNR